MDEVEMQALKPFLDEEGRLRQVPSKGLKKAIAYRYLAQKFEAGRCYSQKEVNATLASWHTFNDFYLLRREMVDRGLLKRTDDGSAYWLP